HWNSRATASPPVRTTAGIRLRAAHISTHVAERGVRSGPQRLDGDEAGQDDQGQHDGVFHRRRSLFGDEKTPDDGGGRSEHDGTSTEKARPALCLQSGKAYAARTYRQGFARVILRASCAKRCRRRKLSKLRLLCCNIARVGTLRVENSKQSPDRSMFARASGAVFFHLHSCLLRIPTYTWSSGQIHSGPRREVET